MSIGSAFLNREGCPIANLFCCHADAHRFFSFTAFPSVRAMCKLWLLLVGHCTVAVTTSGFFSGHLRIGTKQYKELS